MENSTIKTLAGTPPPGRQQWKFKTATTAHAELNRLEILAGLPRSPISFNLGVANRRIDDLASRVPAIQPAPAAPPVPAAPVAAAPMVIDFSQWRQMSDSDQRSFCRDGGKMHRDSFVNEMTPAGQNFFLAAGGKLFVAPAAPVTAKTKNPPPAACFCRNFWRSRHPSNRQSSPKARNFTPKIYGKPTS